MLLEIETTQLESFRKSCLKHSLIQLVKSLKSSLKVIINSIEIIEVKLPNIKIKINCSKGTYIRSIAHDLGKKLQNGAHLISLVRTSIGAFSLESSLKIEDFEKKLNS